MKNWSKLAIILAILTTCLPAHGEILIYQMKMKFFSTLGEEEPWTSVSEETVNGYLVLDVDYAPDGSIDSINNAVRYEYERIGRYKWYYTYTHYFDVISIDSGRSTEWILVEKEYLAGAEIWIMRGKARDADIGLGRDEKRAIARSIKGDIHVAYYGVEGGFQTCEFSIRLNSQWTKQANDVNQGNQDFSYATEDIVEAYLEDNGYNPS